MKKALSKKRAGRGKFFAAGLALGVGLGLALLLMAPARAGAQAVRIGSLGLSGPLLPLWLAQDKGLFTKQGLSSELITITFQGGTPTVQALLSGGIGFAATSTDTGANARLRGGDVVGIAEWVNSFPYMLVTAKEIDRGEKLKGKKIAISRFGGAAHYAARLALGKLGVPEKETQMLQIGDESVRLTALRQGFVDATVLTPPTNLTARNLGFNVLISLLDSDVKYSFDTIFTSRDYAAKNRETVLRFLRGFLSGTAMMKKNPRREPGSIKEMDAPRRQERARGDVPHLRRDHPGQALRHRRGLEKSRRGPERGRSQGAADGVEGHLRLHLPARDR